MGVVGAENGLLHGDRRHRERGSAPESRAPTGGVVIGGATLRAVPGVRATSLGEIEVKASASAWTPTCWTPGGLTLLAERRSSRA